MTHATVASTSCTNIASIIATANEMALSPGIMSARKLAYLDMGLFCQLRDLGTSRERICQAMNLSESEYSYLCLLR